MGEAEEYAIDLHGVDKARRKARWSEWVRASFPGFEVTSMCSSFGRARGISLGGARLSQICCPTRVTLQCRSIAADKAFVVLQLAGSHSVEGRTRAWHIQPGQLSLARSGGDFEVSTETASRHLFLELPWSSLVATHPCLQSVSAQVFAADEPGVALVRDLLRGTLASGARLDVAQRRVTLTALVQLIGVLFAGVMPADRNEWRVQRALADIERQLPEPTLDAASVAERQGISRRRLDALFMCTMGTTMSARIAARRLYRAAELLREPCAAERSIIEVALSVGFRDPAHFSRAFKARFGISPRAWRSIHDPVRSVTD